jgi:hypothetical protein
MIAFLPFFRIGGWVEEKFRQRTLSREQLDLQVLKIFPSKAVNF